MRATTTRPMTPSQIKKARLARQMTQSQFGAILGGYSQTDVSHWEKGVTSVPKAVRIVLKLQSNSNTTCFLNCLRHTIPEPFAQKLNTDYTEDYSEEEIETQETPYETDHYQHSPTELPQLEEDNQQQESLQKNEENSQPQAQPTKTIFEQLIDLPQEIKHFLPDFTKNETD